MTEEKEKKRPLSYAEFQEQKATLKVPFYRNPYFLAAVVSMIILPLMRPFLRHVPPAPAVMYQAPNYQFKNQSGDIFGSEQLKGKVYVASFLFTRCTTACPLVTGAMVELQKRFSDSQVPVQIVSFTVDPDYDSPEVLKEFGLKNGANFDRWTFVTGETLAIKSLLENGFKVPVGDAKKSGDIMDIAHTKKVVLVDGLGGIRGYYGTDESGIDEIFHRSQHVLNDMRKTK